MTDIALRLEHAMTITTGTPVHVSWSFREFALQCSRRDGRPLTHRMFELFHQLIGRESSRDLSAAPDEHETLRTVLTDLERSADHQAARAANLDDVVTSATLFALADGIRQHAAQLHDTAPREETYAAIDHARSTIVTALLALDELKHATEASR